MDVRGEGDGGLVFLQVVAVVRLGGGAGGGRRGEPEGERGGFIQRALLVCCLGRPWPQVQTTVSGGRVGIGSVWNGRWGVDASHAGGVLDLDGGLRRSRGHFPRRGGGPAPIVVGGGFPLVWRGRAILVKEARGRRSAAGTRGGVSSPVVPPSPAPILLLVLQWGDGRLLVVFVAASPESPEGTRALLPRRLQVKPMLSGLEMGKHN